MYRALNLFWIFVLLLCVINVKALAVDVQNSLTLANIFTDHMVLQRDTKVPVWGTAAADQQVTVEFASKKYVAVADGEGRWTAMLDAMPAGGPYVMTVSANGRQVQLNDVFMGDVWLAAGQSNMAFRFSSATDPDKDAAIEGASNLNIRTYEVAKVFGGGKVLNEDDRPWIEVNATNIGDWSAVGFYFARGLFQHLDVPIGIINCNQGGSTIEAWMSEQSLMGTKVPEQRYQQNHSGFKNWATLYHSMLSGIIPYKIKGVLWYQGESNAHAAEHYDDLLSAMIRDWRKRWNDPKLAFLIVQLPRFARKEDSTGETWAYLRETQMKVASSVPHTAMVVVIDAGDENDIHPTNKRVVGERLVLAARGMVYNERLDFSGPTVKKVTYRNGQAIVTYEHADEGLSVKGKNIKGFDIRDADGNWHPAKARLEENKISVSHETVKEIYGVRYAWANAPDVNLFDASGLPAVPFQNLRSIE